MTRRFLSAAASQALAGPISDIDADGKGWAPIASRGLAAGVVGGTVASISGGNFENGMITSAFAQMYNDDDAAGENGLEKMVDSLLDKLTPGAQLYAQADHCTPASLTKFSVH